MAQRDNQVSTTELWATLPIRWRNRFRSGVRLARLIRENGEPRCTVAPARPLAAGGAP